MEYSPELLEIGRKAFRDHPHDIAKQKEQAFDDLRASDEYEDWREQCDRMVANELVWAARRAVNVGIKNPPAKPKVIQGESGVLSEIAHDMNSWHFKLIAGRTLGHILGKEIPGLVNGLKNQRHAMGLEAKLLERLRKLTPNDKRIGESVSASKIKDMAIELGLENPPRPARKEKASRERIPVQAAARMAGK